MPPLFSMIRYSYDPLQDNESYLSLVEFMGSDLTVVNDARVSYNSESHNWQRKDEKLIKYLLTTKPMHKSPLYGCVLKFKVTCPLFVRNQWWKHHVASNYTSEQDGWNEQSLRYSQADMKYYVPDVLHQPSTQNRQKGSEPLARGHSEVYKGLMRDVCNKAFNTYKLLLDGGVSREEARMVLPCNTYTSFIWTVSLMSVLNFMDLRNHQAAQYEIKKYAECIDDVVKGLFPNVYKYWTLPSYNATDK